MENDNFFQIVDDRVAAGDCNPGLRKRMQQEICQKCHAQYRKKFPGKPFQIVCDGIYEDEDYQEIADETQSTLHDVKEVMDHVYWAKNHFREPDETGTYRPFIARPYQEEILRCTAERKVDRCARGLGKTRMAWIEELHIATTRKNFATLVITPQKHQAEEWYDHLIAACENDPELEASIVGRKKAPFYQIRFANGTTLTIFTAGSKSGGKGNGVRSQSPRRVRLEEQDLLEDADYSAIMPLLRRYKEIQFHGTSTPLGKRETYWEMCTKYQDYREFYFPISVHPDWNSASLNEEVLRREAHTDSRYEHEFLAQFGDQEAGVFKGVYVDISRKSYNYTVLVYDSGWRYWMGVDWNGQGTGTRIRVVGFNTVTNKRRMVDRQMIDDSNQASIEAIVAMNRKWHCEGVVIDAGFGNMQGEILQKIGADSPHPDDRKLKKIQIIDFGGTLEFNHLIPRRDNTRYIKEDPLKRRTKPFMVEGAVMCLENGLFEFSEEDKILDEQFRAYVVKSWSQHGYANTYDSGTVGDHDLDASMLALLGIELRYGLFYQPHKRPSTLSSLSMVSGFGREAVQMDLQASNQTETQREATKSAAGIPSRNHTMMNPSKAAALHNGQAFVVMGNRPGTGRQGPPAGSRGVPSRTGGFRSPYSSDRPFFPRRSPL